MRIASIASLICCSLLINLAGCSSKPSGDNKVLVTVANKSITLEDFRKKLARLPSYYKEMAEKNRKNLLEDMIVESLFLEDAVRKGVDRDKEVRDILDEAKKKIIVAKLVKTEVDDKLSVSEDELKKFYEENKDKFKKPQMWRASHILVASEGEAKNILNELLAGKNFEDLAKEKSTDATAARGGDVGYFRKGQVVAEFENTCADLSVGQLSGIVRTQFGYHVIKLTDRKDESIESFDEAKPAIEYELKLKKRDEAFDKLVSDLKYKYRVRVEDDTERVLEALGPDKSK